MILSFDSHDLEDRRHLSRVVGDTPVDKLVNVVVLRDCERMTVVVTVGKLPDERKGPMMESDAVRMKKELEKRGLG